MKRLIALIGLFIAGCATGTNTVEVKVPVSVPCRVEHIDMQPLPVDAMQGTEDIFSITKALWATVELQSADIIKLKAAVDACQ